MITKKLASGTNIPLLIFHISLLGYTNKQEFSFANVKTTEKGVAKGKLQDGVSKADVLELKKFTVPVYLFGVDHRNQSNRNYK